ETKVDVANNTNTFPLIPTSTLRINAKPLLQFSDPYPGSGAPNTTEYSDDAFEVVAQRVVTRGFAATLTGGGLYNEPTNVPYIRGRSTFPLQAVETTSDRTLNNTSFSAYAPEGIYAISVWRSESGTNYRNYQPNTQGGDTSSLGSSLVGFAIVRVDPSSGTSLLGDWSLVNGTGSEDTNYIPLRKNKFIIWGRVIRQNGTMAVGSFSSWADNANVYLYNPQQDGTTSAHSDPKMRNHGCGEHFWTYPLSGFSQCGDDPTRDLPDNFMNSYGIYTFYEINSALLEGLTPRNGDFEVYISTNDDPNLSTAQSEKVPTGNIFTTAGPVQVDLLLAEEVPNVFFEMIMDLSSFTFNAQAEDVNQLSPESIDVDIRVANPEDLNNITDGAVDIVSTETHHPDSAGRVKIPLSD
ncbi:hypothetical protein KC573_04505, partial [candidate division WWE3 bacterium]|nr:hypothetical protein [candidate division WWE3 bacterium]